MIPNEKNIEIEKLKNEITQKQILLDNKFINLCQSNKQLVDENIKYKGQISIIEKEKEKLIDQLKQRETQISS